MKPNAYFYNLKILLLRYQLLLSSFKQRRLTKSMFFFSSEYFTMAWKPIHFALAGMMVVFGKITLIVEYRGVHRVEI